MLKSKFSTVKKEMRSQNQAEFDTESMNNNSPCYFQIQQAGGWGDYEEKKDYFQTII